MANLAFEDRHNQVASLTRTDENLLFHPMLNFLRQSHIAYAITVSPLMHFSHINQFWNTARVELVNDVQSITARVDNRRIVVTETAIRRVLRLNDENGVIDLPYSEIEPVVESMGYAGDIHDHKYIKTSFPTQYKFLFHVLLQCLSAKKSSLEQIASNTASHAVCLIDCTIVLT